MSDFQEDSSHNRRHFLGRSLRGLGTVAAAHLAGAETQAGPSAGHERSAGKTMNIDAHGHISQVEIQDIQGPETYKKGYKYGMSHRDNLYLMDAVGVDMQVLQCAFHLHGYHRRVMKEHPDRFVAITKIDERLLPGEEGLKLIQTHIEDWGFRGLFYDTWRPEERVKMGFDPKDWGTPDPFYHFDHPRYDPQWELLQSLGVPVCITCYPENFKVLGPGFLNVMKRFPDLKVVIIHGIDPPSCLLDDGSVRIPEAVVELVKNHDVVMELLTGLDGLRNKPNRYGPDDQVIRAFYDTFGPEKLMWGTEFTYIELPTVEQYRYQFDYIKNRCPYMSAADIDQIRGGTAMRVYQIAG